MRTPASHPITIAVVSAFAVCVVARAAHAEPNAAQVKRVTLALIPTMGDHADAPAIILNPMMGGHADAPTFMLEHGVARVGLSFDTQAIPAGVSIESAILRLVPDVSDAEPAEQLIRIYRDRKSTSSIGQMKVGKHSGAVESIGTGLIDALEHAASSLTVYLGTDSVRVRRRYYSASDRVEISARRPRLIVSWKDTMPLVTRASAQLRYRGNPDDVTPWRNDGPQAAVVSTLVFEQILAGPVFRRDELLLIARKTAGSQPQLYGIGLNGQERWATALPALIPAARWKYLLVDPADRLLAFPSQGAISGFEDFGVEGPQQSWSKAVAGMELSKRPALSAGGMVTFLSQGYVYALSAAPRLDELWRSPHSVGPAEPPTPSPRGGDGLIYTIGKGANPNDAALLAIDAARGELRFPPKAATADARFPSSSKLANFTNFHPPLVVPGAEHDWVVLSAFSDAAGVLEGYSDFTKGDPSAWHPKAGGISRCIAPPASSGQPPAIYCVQRGQLRGFKLSTGEQTCESPAANQLGATSNLLADGDGNIYFWNEKQKPRGAFHGFDRACHSLFSAELHGLAAKTDGSEVLDLHMGPDGVVYATSDKTLLAIEMLRHADAPMPRALLPSTRYTTRGPMKLTAPTTVPTNGPVALAAIDGSLSLGNLEVPAGADVTCRAAKGISFDAGFRVRVGGVLRCSVDATKPQ